MEDGIRNEVHGHSFPRGRAGSDASRAYEALLEPEERARRDRYLFEPSRREYLLTRALVRTTLSRYAPVAPAAWRFRANEHGRPEVALANGVAFGSTSPTHAASSSARFAAIVTSGLTWKMACAPA